MEENDGEKGLRGEEMGIKDLENASKG